MGTCIRVIRGSWGPIASHPITSLVPLAAIAQWITVGAGGVLPPPPPILTYTRRIPDSPPQPDVRQVKEGHGLRRTLDTADWNGGWMRDAAPLYIYNHLALGQLIHLLHTHV
ncbi:unnamed protein product [Orchesella dallaii]|uniref:Uncharacterized protein n=1 Tax=Orchesella dallaii TaxID=48710 RepID=A0ABP1R4E9_9HEXA